jgi:hypothetical protein
VFRKEADRPHSDVQPSLAAVVKAYCPEVDTGIHNLSPPTVTSLPALIVLGLTQQQDAVTFRGKLEMYAMTQYL